MGNKTAKYVRHNSNILIKHAENFTKMLRMVRLREHSSALCGVWASEIRPLGKLENQGFHLENQEKNIGHILSEKMPLLLSNTCPAPNPVVEGKLWLSPS